MRTIDLSSAPRTFEYTPRSPTARSSFLPSPSPPTVPPPPPRPGRTSPCFEMKPAKATPTPRAETRAPSLIPSFFTPKPDSSSNITPKPKPKRAGPKAAPSSNEFDGIEEISEADITIEELQRSEARKAARAMNRLSSKGPSSSAHSGPGASSAPTIGSDEPELEHIDLSGLSSPVHRAPRKHASGQPSLLSAPALASAVDEPSSGRTGTSGPPIRSRTRRRVVSSDDDDVYEPLVRPIKGMGKTKAVPASSSLAQKSPAKDKGKGKARADPHDEDEPAHGVLNDVDMNALDDYSDGWDDTMLNHLDDFDGLDPALDFGPVDDIPDFTMMPSTQPPRSRSMSPIYIDDDDDLPQFVSTSTGLSGAAARAAALGTSYLPDEGSSPSKVIMKFDDLTFLDDMPPDLRAFYEEHWRRGADKEGGNDSDDDPDAFGVAAVVPKRQPAKGGFRGGFHGGRGGRGRGRGRGRGWKSNRK